MLTVKLRGGGTITGMPAALVSLLVESGSVPDGPTITGNGSDEQQKAEAYLRRLERRRLLTIEESA